MPNTVITQRERDAKEKELDIIKEMEEVKKKNAIECTKIFEKRLADYQVWKIDNKIEGIKY